MSPTTTHVRAVSTSLPSHTSNPNDLNPSACLTASANGAIATQDGVALALGDRLLVVGGADPGLYHVVDLGSSTSPWKLSRLDESVKSGDRFTVAGDGTTWGGSTWLCTGVGPATFLPQFSSGTTTLASGAGTVTGLFVRTGADITIEPHGAFSSAGFLRASSVVAGNGDGQVAVTSSSASDATPIAVTARNF